MQKKKVYSTSLNRITCERPTNPLRFFRPHTQSKSQSSLLLFLVAEVNEIFFKMVLMSFPHTEKSFFSFATRKKSTSNSCSCTHENELQVNLLNSLLSGCHIANKKCIFTKLSFGVYVSVAWKMKRVEWTHNKPGTRAEPKMGVQYSRFFFISCYRAKAPY